MVNRNFKALYGGGCPASDYYVKVQGCGRDRFELALALAFNSREARFWTLTDSYGMIFFWHVPTEHLGENESILEMSELFWEPKFMHQETKQPLYVLDNRKWTHEVKYHEFDTPQCVGQCLDIAWNWLCDTDYPPKPQFNPYEEGYNGCSGCDYEEGEDAVRVIPGFEIGTHLDRFRSIHHCEGAICYVRPSWLHEY